MWYAYVYHSILYNFSVADFRWFSIEFSHSMYILLRSCRQIILISNHPIKRIPVVLKHRILAISWDHRSKRIILLKPFVDINTSQFRYKGHFSISKNCDTIDASSSEIATNSKTWTWRRLISISKRCRELREIYVSSPRLPDSCTWAPRFVIGQSVF